MEPNLFPPPVSPKEPKDSEQFCAESPTGIERRRAAPRIYSVLLVLMVGMILNTIMWLTGNATEYEYLPATLVVASVVLIVHLLTDRRKAKSAVKVASRKLPLG